MGAFTKVYFFWILLLICTGVLAQPLTILHTSDIHSHFLNKDSPFKLGGVARLSQVIKEQKALNQNVLILDSGDFSEGSIFFTYNHGISTLKIMDLMGYDGIVLGNHDWLMGPNELFMSLLQASVPLPLLSANLEGMQFEPKKDLRNFIKPYTIKDFPGLRVGILGLSTFQFIFDTFFEPVKIIDPEIVAQKAVDLLRQKEHCDVVIALSHLGYSSDQRLAKKVKGIDAVIGGHSHILLKRPALIDGIPIFHIGKWGHYLGAYSFDFSDGKLKFIKSQILPVKEDILEDVGVSNLVDENLRGLDQQWKLKLQEKILTSERDIPLKDYRSDSIVGHWVADALREMTHTDIAFENPSYVSRDIFKGDTGLMDFFNIFPHIFSPQIQKAWTIKTFKMSGSYLRVLLSAVFRAGIYLRLSNASVVLDHYRSINQVRSLEVGGAPIDNRKIYTVSGTNGVLEAIGLLKTYGIDVGVQEVTDTGMEAWRIVADYFKRLSPITPEKLKWEGRVRTYQPDVVILPEEIFVSTADSGSERHAAIEPGARKLEFKVRNTGMQLAMGSYLSIKLAAKPFETLYSDERVIYLDGAKEFEIPPIGPGQDFSFEVPLPSDLPPGRFAITFGLTPAMAEMETENNVLDSYIDIP